MKHVSNGKVRMRHNGHFCHIGPSEPPFLVPPETIFNFKINLGVGILEIPRLPKAPLSAHLSQLLMENINETAKGPSQGRCALCFVSRPTQENRFWAFLSPMYSGLAHRSASQVRNYSPGYIGQAPSRGHEASAQSGLGVGCKLRSSSKKLRGLSVGAAHKNMGKGADLVPPLCFFACFPPLPQGQRWRVRRASPRVAYIRSNSKQLHALRGARPFKV